METYVMRLWLPDRPGALGAVASRIGAVKGDVIGIEILETGAGQAIDELVVKIPDSTLLDLLVAEVRQVDEVHVEEVRSTRDGEHDPRLEGLAAAAALVGAPDAPSLLAALEAEVTGTLGASWVSVFDGGSGRTIVGTSTSPPSAWVGAFLAGVRSAADLGGPDADDVDVIGSDVVGTDLAIVAGRDGRAWRTRERRHLDALASIFARCWVLVGPAATDSTGLAASDRSTVAVH